MLGRAGLVVVATSAGEPVVVDRQLRPDATVLAVGAHTVDTRELHEDVLRGAQVIVEDVGLRGGRPVMWRFRWRRGRLRAMTW
ncbi:MULTISPECIES: hypothetical protein [Corynebacterium]|uniref:hypothetical protein n=1 Tax=Corynebacterium TaxID=1716 RepID=UPI0035B270C9